ncbi:MAG: DUF262 domain-containing protein [Acidimicrobiia bacterium]|nr:DUF262 domain-containing protein [Acidimicrobiia bacterium]
MNDSTEAIETIESEIEDQQADLKSFDILTYPADYTLEGLVQKYQSEEIVIPTFQRSFVWSKVQASRLIDSFLKGLPVPPIFLYTETDSDKLLVIDGQQRLKSIAYFFEGFFGEEKQGKRPVFRLSGLEEHNQFQSCTYSDLESQFPSFYSKLNNSVLRSFIMRQVSSEDNTSIYHVFERLNTGGTTLSPQEIRNCIHHGRLNDLLHDLNDLEEWRTIFGRQDRESRQRDIELILRFFALLELGHKYEKPMKNFLNEFMANRRSPDEKRVASYSDIFLRTTSVIERELGPRPFHIRTGLNAAVFDCVYVAVAKQIDNLPEDLGDRYRKLINDNEFLERVTSATTDETTVSRRLEIAFTALQ